MPPEKTGLHSSKSNFRNAISAAVASEKAMDYEHG
jgi:hypothetical protein